MIIDRETARKLGHLSYFTGKPCQNGHVAHRYVSSGTCLACAESDRKRYRLDPEKRIKKSISGKAYYIANSEKILTRSKQWRLDNPERHLKKSRDHYASIRGRAKSLLKAAQNRAFQRNFTFDLDLEWIISKLQTGKCEITCIDFIFETRLSKHRNPYSPSLDRRDNSKGYTKENCRIILWALNMGFADWGQETYLKIARRLVEFDL